MRVWIGLASSNEAVKRYFGEQKQAVVPQEVLQRGFFQDRKAIVTVNVFSEPVLSRDKLESFILERSADHLFSVLVIDQELLDLVDNINGYTFIAPIDLQRNIYNPQNIFHRLLSTTFKNLHHVASWMTEGGKTQEILCLPLRNFQATELAEIARIFRENSLSRELPNAVEHQISVLRRNNVRPRKRSKSPSKYIIDDLRRFYSFGKEHHSLPETGERHKASCIIAAQYRFGYNIDATRHFNVSSSEGDDTVVDGKFYNCHGILRHEKHDTHLNMFASDMYYK